MNYDDRIKLWRNLEPGMSETVSKTMTESDVILWGGISGDISILYFDREFSRTKRFGDVVVPGLCVAGLISAAVNKVAFGNIYAMQNLRFVKPVFIGDTITATATIVEKVGDKHMIKIATRCENQNGELVIDGEALQYIME